METVERQAVWQNGSELARRWHNASGDATETEAELLLALGNGNRRKRFMIVLVIPRVVR